MTIPLLTAQNYRILSKNTTNRKPIYTIMSYITEDEEVMCDSKAVEEIIISRGDKTFKTHKNNLICYGDIDFDNEEDIKLIKRFRFLDYLGGAGIPFPANYDYNTHTCKSNGKKIMWSETWSPLDVMKFAHASLGKPERIILFTCNKL